MGDTLLPGLLVTEYPRHPKQPDAHGAHLPIEELGTPIGVRVVTRTVCPWKHESERNAVARGYLRIDEDGDYAFSTDSFYDRNVLVIGGKLVCPYADGGGRTVTIPLKKGLVEFLCAGYYGGRGASGIQVKWRPPGVREVVAIPATASSTRPTISSPITSPLPPRTSWPPPGSTAIPCRPASAVSSLIDSVPPSKR